VKKPKLLRIMGSCVVALAIFFAGCESFCDIFIGPLEIGVSLLSVVIVLLNLLQASLLFMWADIIERCNTESRQVGAQSL
jgi:hypothetical protein